jgi:2-isopropylmalate synthase/UPF0716 protein FxsA
MISSFFITILGGLLTFVEIVGSAFLGIMILQNSQYSLQENIQKIRSGQLSQEEFLANNLAKSLGAILLIIPGFFTDILGILLQFGILLGLFGFLFKNKRTNTNNSYYTKEQNNEIIDVEVIEKSNTTNDHNYPTK